MTNSVMSETGFSEAAFNAFIESRDEPGWLIDQRRSAWNVFCETPLPSKKEEEWMRTDIRLLKLDVVDGQRVMWVRPQVDQTTGRGTQDFSAERALHFEKTCPNTEGSQL